jgi:hypothetical protein
MQARSCITHGRGGVCPEFYVCTLVTGGNAVALLVKALRYKPEGHEFDSRCHWTFSLT